VASLPEQEGLVGWSLRRDLGGTEVWTMTVWRDGEAADDFLVSPAHREAMRASREVFATTRFARVDWPTSGLPPTWDQAEALLAASSRGG
jgi:heme-degrading monooxygenase HmoA